MKLLLDTHVFLWWANEPERLSETALAALTDPANQLLLSVAAAWEMQIKIQVGKLRLNGSLKQLIAKQQRTNGIQLLPVELSRVLALTPLPLHHRDPFDRLMIAQALDEGLTLVSADSAFSAYAAPTLW